MICHQNRIKLHNYILNTSLQYPKTVILHRRERASWGFSIVGGASDPAAAAAAAALTNGGAGGAPNANNANGVGVGVGVGVGGGVLICEPIHVLFVVPDSPAAKDAKIK